MKNPALVLEGGALRSLYTSGVLDVLMENGVKFPYVIGTSAGSLCGLNYLSNQIGRTAGINIGYTSDKNYISLRNLFRHEGIFNLDYLFAEPHGRWADLDEEAYLKNDAQFVIVATSCETGEAVYFEKPAGKMLEICLKASSSMPLASQMVPTPQGYCLDGGVADSIPYQKAIDDGFDSVVVVRTQARDYRKSEWSPAMARMYRTAYKKRPQFLQRALNRPAEYNAQVEGLYALEDEGRAFVIAPQNPVSVGRMEKDRTKLEALYERAKNEAEEILPTLLQFMEG